MFCSAASPTTFTSNTSAEVADAIPGAQVSLIDGEMTSWYGSRAILGLRYLDDYTRAATTR